MDGNVEIRWAKPSDRNGILDLLHEMHADIGIFPLSEAKLVDKVMDVMDHGQVILGYADGNLVGSVGLSGSELWYSNQPIISDYWIFVTPKCRRRLSVFRLMVAKAREYAEQVNLPLVLALYSQVENKRKSLLFSRYGTRIMQGFQFAGVGGEYLIGKGGK